MSGWKGAVLLIAVLVLAAPSAAQAAFPGQNGKIAFTSDRSGAFQIYAMNPDGSGQTQLTNDGGNFQPAWSPDGRRIAFVSNRDPSDQNCNDFDIPCNTEIYFMNADGSGQTRVTDTTTNLEDGPVWAADGQRITYHRLNFCGSFGCSENVVTVDPDGTSPQYFAAGGCALSDPAWSPDGTRLAFTALQYDEPCGDGSGLFVARSDGSNRQKLCCATSAPFPFAPDWAPDQSEIAFAQITRAANQIAKVSPDGSGLTVIHDDALYPGWSPDGTKIAFSRNTDGNWEIYTMSPNGTGDVRLTDNPAIDSQPDWQPLPGPQRKDFKNAAQFCKAQRDFLGGQGFRQRYGGGASAYGRCVSTNGA